MGDITWLHVTNFYPVLSPVIKNMTEKAKLFSPPSYTSISRVLEWVDTQKVCSPQICKKNISEFYITKRMNWKEDILCTSSSSSSREIISSRSKIWGFHIKISFCDILRWHAVQSARSSIFRSCFLSRLFWLFEFDKANPQKISCISA